MVAATLLLNRMLDAEPLTTSQGEEKKTITKEKTKTKTKTMKDKDKDKDKDCEPPLTTSKGV